MSKIADIKAADPESQKIALATLIAQYESDLDALPARVEIKGKLLEHANRENPSWQVYYDQKRAELHTLTKYFDMEVQRIRGRLYKNFTENNSRALGDRAIEKYIDHEKAYLDMYELYLEIKELHEMFEAAVEAFRARGYALNNITRIRVAALEDGLV